MGVKNTTSASRDRFNTDTWQNGNQTTNSNNTTNTNSAVTGNTNGTTSGNTSGVQNDLLSSLTQALQTSNQATQGNTNATFSSPQGQAVLGSLTGSTTNGQGDKNVQQAGNTLGQLSSGQVSPYTEDIIKNANIEADRNFGNRLAQTRSGAYRGGTASNLNQQGQLASDFSAQQSLGNANLRQGAYQDAQTRALQASTAQGNLGSQQQGLGAQLLALLKGESTSGTLAGTQGNNTQTNQNNSQTTNQNTNQANNQNNTQNTSTQSTQQILENILSALTGGSSGSKSSVSDTLTGSFGKT